MSVPAVATPAPEAADPGLRLETADPGLRAETAELGMWVFLATEALFFGGLLFAYLVARLHWTEGFASAARHADVLLGTLNTALLLSSSFTVAAAVAADERGLRRWTAGLLWATVALGLAFLAVKGLEYRQDGRQGLVPGAGFALAATPGAELFFVLYFLATGLHALHLAIGLVLLGAFALGSGRGSAWARAPRLAVAGLYWHFVDLVWIFLYPLLYLVQRHP